MNMGGIADSLNIVQGKDLIKYAYSDTSENVLCTEY